MSNSTIFFIVFISIVSCGILLILALHAISRNKETAGGKDPFINDEGNHVYYDRSIIEKSQFSRNNPKVPAHKLRTFSRLYKEFLR